jgi:RNA polymerase sigma factor (sigma-70 family)
MTKGAKESRLQRFFRKERARLVAYVRGRIADAADRDGEDIVQDVLLSVFSRPEPLLAVENVPGYVYQSLRNRVTDTFRRRWEGQVSLDTVGQGVEAQPLAETLPDPKPDPGQAALDRESAQRFFEALAAMDPDDQAVIIETELEGRSFQELSEAWGVPVGTLLARKSRALKKLKARLAD